MIRSFHHRGLRRLYERGDPSRVGADQLDRITLALADLDAASKPSDVDLPGYRLHPLRGDLEGLWSISTSGNWRITFRFEDGNVYDVDLGRVHTKRSISKMSVNEMNPRNITSSFSKREKMRRNPFNRRNSLSISLRLLYISRSYSHG